MADLDQIAARSGAQFVMAFGRRRVGKTTLLTKWAKRTGLPVFYWVAKRETRSALMTNLVEQLITWERGGTRSSIQLKPQDWDAVLGEVARVVGKRRCIVILDELPYLIESDPSFLTYLQAAWDHLFKQTEMRLLVSGSHIGMMTELLSHNAPLYGRFTSQLPVESLRFTDIAPFLPHYNVHKRLAVFAVLGGVPAYLERWDSKESLAKNIQELFFQRTGWFRNEPTVLISDLTRRETDGYEGVLRAIAAGNHTRDRIARASEIPNSALSHYLPRLIEMRLIERRLPATVPPSRQRQSRESRYVLKDSYLRFYYRFVDANLHLIEQGLADVLWERIEEQFRSFVAETFEELCRAWVLAMARKSLLPVNVETIGAHWSRDCQVDVAAVDFRGKRALLGECKWGAGKVGLNVLTELKAKAARVFPKGKQMRVFYVLFARDGFTSELKTEAAKQGILLRTLAEMEPELAE